MCLGCVYLFGVVCVVCECGVKSVRLVCVWDGVCVVCGVCGLWCVWFVCVVCVWGVGACVFDMCVCEV